MSFWDDVAARMPQRDKTAHECREKWFSLVKTPKPRTRENGKRNRDDLLLAQKAGDRRREEEDDVFNSTPLRQGEQPTDCYEQQLPAGLDLLSLGEERMDVEPASDDERLEPSHNLPVAKPGFKSYLQGMRRDLNRSRKNHKPDQRSKTKKDDAARLRKATYLRENFQDEDVKMKAELTPGGTLKIHGAEQEVDEDDFWGLYADDFGEDG
jgi:hypothetical protein